MFFSQKFKLWKGNSYKYASVTPARPAKKLPMSMIFIAKLNGGVEQKSIKENCEHLERCLSMSFFLINAKENIQISLSSTILDPVLQTATLKLWRYLFLRDFKFFDVLKKCWMFQCCWRLTRASVARVQWIILPAVFPWQRMLIKIKHSKVKIFASSYWQLMAVSLLDWGIGVGSADSSERRVGRLLCADELLSDFAQSLSHWVGKEQHQYASGWSERLDCTRRRINL